MCGLSGQLNFNNQEVKREMLEKMTLCLSHRGPDGSGLFLGGPVGLGHRRLAIIDLSERGQQPMSDSQNEIYIVFNGEVYNFLELRKELEKDGIKFSSGTDTEVIIYLYKKYSFDCLKYLRGMFAFAIWDKKKKLLFIARDRLGKKPLKYYHDANSFIFASELKAILANPAVKKEIDHEAIDEYLTFKYVPAPKTGFKNIKKLLPAHYLIVKENGEITEKKYWDINFEEKLGLPEEEWLEKIEQTIKEAVAIRLLSDVALGAHLSGGIDSSLIVAMMAEASGKQIKTFSIGFEEAGYNELPFARLVAQKYQTDHHEFMIKPDAAGILSKLAYYYEEPYADASAIAYWHLSEMTKKHITVALNGDGGDENFAGYNRHHLPGLYRALRLLPAKKTLAKINNTLFRITGSNKFRQADSALGADYSDLFSFYISLIAYFSRSDKKLIYTKELSSGLPELSSLSGRDYFNKINGSELDKLLYTGLKTHLPDDLLVKADIASMAHGLEMRSPLLDQNLVELAAKIPAELKMKNKEKKYLLKKIAHKYLPKECVDRPKHGFTVPLNYWFRGSLSDCLTENILSKRFIKIGFNGEEIKKLIIEHQKGAVNNENKLYALLMLSFWHKEWF